MTRQIDMPNVLFALRCRQRYLKRMKRKEAELADKLGFKLLCADHSTVAVEEYVQFLDRYDLCQHLKTTSA